MIKKLRNIFDNNFDKKRFLAVFRVSAILFFLVLFLGIINVTLSRYTSEVDADISPNLAFFVTDVGTYQDVVELGEILPSANPYFYTITVSNFDENKRINVNLEYEIEFVVTTNLPLSYKIFRNTTNYTGTGIIVSDTTINDTDGMYLRTLKSNVKYPFSFVADQTDTYVIQVIFPEVYKYDSEKYEGVIELFEIIVNAKQVV